MVVKNRGQHCGDVDLPDVYTTDPVSLVLDLPIAHDRVGSSTDPTLNGQLRYPNKLDQSFNDTDVDKVRKYRVDYNMNPPNTVSFMPTISSTSGRLHSEFVILLFLQDHRETDRLFATFANFSSINHVSIFRYSSSTTNPVYVRHVDSSVLGSSLTETLSSSWGSYPLVPCPIRTVVRIDKMYGIGFHSVRVR
jgi:hypothetical protein